jgi:hypothetical protein
MGFLNFWRGQLSLFRNFWQGEEYLMDVILSTPAKKEHFCFQGTVTNLQLAEQPHSLLELYMAQPKAGFGITGKRRVIRRQG